jgi:hypothetical protein
MVSACPGITRHSRRPRIYQSQGTLKLIQIQLEWYAAQINAAHLGAELLSAFISLTPYHVEYLLESGLLVRVSAPCRATDGTPAPPH